MNKKLRKRQKGFTLVELIVVIAILGILAAVLAPKIMGNVQEAAKQKEVTSAETIASAITVWNAKVEVKKAADPADTTPTIPSSLPTSGKIDIKDTDYKDVTGFEYKDTKLPKTSDVKIKVDEFGNASIEVQGATPPTP